MNTPDLSDVESWSGLPNYQKGKLGENLAVRWLKERNFSIVSRNVRAGRYEVDIVAAKYQCLYAIEVKMRFGNQYGYVQEYLSEPKIQQMKIVGLALLDKYARYPALELILLSIVVQKKDILFSWEEIQ